MKEKIRILHFPISNNKGGITSYALTNWKYIDRSKFHFDFATMSKKIDYLDVIEPDSCVHFISSYHEDDSKRFEEQFETIFSEGNYDIVHLHTTFWKSFEVERIARQHGVKVVIHAHTTDIKKSELSSYEDEKQKHYELQGLLDEQTADAFLACSSKAANFLYGSRIPNDRVQIIKNAIELERFRFNLEKREKTRAELGLAEDEIVLGSVGRLDYPKNHEFLIEVTSRLLSHSDKYRLLIIGDGKRRDNYLEMIDRLGLQDYVQIIGFQRDIERYYSAMDFFLQPSFYEGFPITAVEALANNLLCVESDTISDEICLTDKIVRVPLRGEDWGEYILGTNTNSNDRYEEWPEQLEEYDIKRQIRVLEKIYESVANNRRIE